MDSLPVELAALSRLGSEARRVWGLLLPASRATSIAIQNYSQRSQHRTTAMSSHEEQQ